jgi:hypothetical protein
LILWERFYHCCFLSPIFGVSVTTAVVSFDFVANNNDRRPAFFATRTKFHGIKAFSVDAYFVAMPFIVQSGKQLNEILRAM